MLEYSTLLVQLNLNRLITNSVIIIIIVYSNQLVLQVHFVLFWFMEAAFSIK